jgi:hypothetical protein
LTVLRDAEAAHRYQIEGERGLPTSRKMGRRGQDRYGAGRRARVTRLGRRAGSGYSQAQPTGVQLIAGIADLQTFSILRPRQPISSSMKSDPRARPIRSIKPR